MKLGTFATAAAVLGLAIWIRPVGAQPMWDRVKVSLPYTVTVGEKTLQPGDYVIQQLRDTGGGSRILLIYGDSGMKFETSAMTIPALDTNTARDTKVILHHFGSDYFFDKVWIQGKDYGYEFPVPDSVKNRERERMAAVTVPAQYQEAEKTASANPSDTPATLPETQNAQAAPPAVSPVPLKPDAEPAPTTSSQAAPPQTPAPAPPSMAPATDSNTANREMPETSAGWLAMLLGGGTISGIGLALRRKRQ